jgi:hypothetical protein
MRIFTAAAIAVLVAGCLSGSDVTNPGPPAQAFLSARVGGDSVHAGSPRAFSSGTSIIIGGTTAPSSTRVLIEISVRNPRIGTFDLGESVGPVSTTSASLQIGPAGGALWMTQKAGDGTLTISKLTGSWIEGTFQFTATASNSLSMPTIQQVTLGRFAMPVCTFGSC